MKKTTQFNKQLLKVNLPEALKEDLKVLSYIQGKTMTETVIELITAGCAQHQDDIEEIRQLRQQKSS